MEIQSFKKKKDNKYEILFKDGSSIDLYDDVIIKYNLLSNKKINNLDEITKYNNSLDAYYLAIKYINKKMRTKTEIKKYLAKKEFDDITIKNTVDKLVNNKVIDEDIYIKAFVNDSINFANIGPNKIVNKLYLLGIDKNKSYEYINNIDKKVWIDKIKKIVDKKNKVNKNYSLLYLKNKILTSLINDGYDKELIMEVLEDYDFKCDERIIKKEYDKLKNKLSKKYEGSNLEFQIQMKLKAKGFTSEEIEHIKTGI